MKWKGLACWKKGYLIGIVVFLLFFLFEGLINILIYGGKCVEVCSASSGLCSYSISQCFEITYTYTFIPFKLFYLIANTQTISQDFLNTFLLNSIMMFVINLLIYFCVGAIIGWLISKVLK